MMDLAPVDDLVIARAKSRFAVTVRAIDAILVATAEILAAEAEGGLLEFWTHDDRQATAALSRGLTVRRVCDGRNCLRTLALYRGAGWANPRDEPARLIGD
jgi:hypothetical protein